MSLQFSVTVRNARGDAVESTISTAPTLEIRTGAPPANCAAADSGSVLATLTLPSDWLAAAALGVKALAGTWSDSSADGSGTAGHFRIKVGATCHIQGTITATGGGGDMTLNNAVLAAAQAFSITSFNITEGNA